MTLRGHIQNGKVILDTPAELPNGTEVNIQPARKNAAAKRSSTKRRNPQARKKAPKRRTPSLYEALTPFLGVVKDLPPDASINHDHYLYGASRRA